VSFISHGYAYLTETRFDQMEPILETVRRTWLALGLPLRSVEIELGRANASSPSIPRSGLPAPTR